MWLIFGLAVLASLAFLYIPGFLFFRGLGMRAFHALLAAPLGSVAAYCLASLVLVKVGISCSWVTVAIPVVVIALVLYAWRIVKEGFDAESLLSHRQGLYIVLYCGVGAVLGLLYFVFALDTPLSVVKEYDNCFHLDVIRALVDSGTWSVLDVGKYMTQGDMPIAPHDPTGFYPAAWHILCALVMTLTGCAPALAENAVNYSSCFIMFPASMLFLFMKAFEKRRIVLLGSVCILAFVAYPWALLIWGPVFPNAFSLALAPAASAVFICLVEALIDSDKRLTFFVALLMGMIALALSQPNTLFFCVFLLTPYGVYRLWTLGDSVKLGGLRVSHRLCAILFIAFVAMVCVALAYSPSMPNFLIAENWPITKTRSEAFANILDLSFAWYNAQPVLAVVLAIGLAYTIFKRQYLWITIAYLVFCLVYFAGVALDGLPKALLAGYWYSDGYRLAACKAIVGAPLVALGLNAIVGLLCKVFSKHPFVVRVGSTFVIAAFVIATYCPQLVVAEDEPSTPFNQYFSFMTYENLAPARSLYEMDEQSFVQKVKELVPEGELVVNVPGDGSGFSYGLDGLRTYYRSFRGYDGADAANPWEGGETRTSRLIREGAINIASDSLVAEAFDEIGARYVLVLDAGDAYDEQPTQVTDPELFFGIMAIDENTPGFELVMSDGDMRLYKRVL